MSLLDLATLREVVAAEVCSLAGPHCPAAHRLRPPCLSASYGQVVSTLSAMGGRGAHPVDGA